MNMDDLLKDIGQKNTPQTKRKTVPRIRYLNYMDLKPSPYNFYETTDIETLANAILLAGEIKNPLHVRKLGKLNEYEVIEGHRRRLATIYLVEKLGLEQFKDVPCIVEDATMSEIEWKLNLILSNFTQRNYTDQDAMTEIEELKALLEQFAKEKGEKIPALEMRKIISSIMGVSKTKVAQLQSINRNLIPEAKEKFEKGELPVSVANEMAMLPQEVQQDLAEQEDVKLSRVKEIKEDFKEKTKCKYDDSKICHTKLIAKQQEHLQTNGSCSGCCRLCDHAHGCRYMCENIPSDQKLVEQPKEVPKCAYDQKFECNIDVVIEQFKPNRNIAECPGCCNICGYIKECDHACEWALQNKKLTEQDLESITFTFQDVKTVLGYVKKQIPNTKIKDEDAVIRLKVMTEALQKYMRDMTERVDYDGEQKDVQ